MGWFRSVYQGAARVGAAAVTGGASEAYLHAKKKMKQPDLEQTPDVPTSSDADVLKARQDEIARRKRAIGRGATILTGGMGVLGDAPVSRRRMLGG